jgi:hypothetical protein
MRLEPIGPTLADHLAPGGKLAEAGETLRYYDAELARLAAAGVPLAATARLLAAQRDLLAHLSIVDAAEPHVWRVTPDTPAEQARLDALVDGAPHGTRGNVVGHL